MQLNKTLYYTHNTLFAFYGILLLLFIFVGLTSAASFDFLSLLLGFGFLGGLAYLHYKAAIEVEMGTETGKLMSTFIGCIFLLGFPIGTCIGILILLNLRKSKWQSNVQLKNDEVLE